CWQRIVGDMFCRIGFVVILYFFASIQYPGLVWTALALSFSFFVFNLFLLLREILHPRSLFNRRYLYYHKSPGFIRARLIFEVARRFLYFVLSFTFMSYTIHRLSGNGAAFSVSQVNVSLFLQHLQSNLNGMTSLGSNSVAHVG